MVWSNNYYCVNYQVLVALSLFIFHLAYSFSFDWCLMEVWPWFCSFSEYRKGAILLIEDLFSIEDREKCFAQTKIKTYIWVCWWCGWEMNIWNTVHHKKLQFTPKAWSTRKEWYYNNVRYNKYKAYSKEHLNMKQLKSWCML